MSAQKFSAVLLFTVMLTGITTIFLALLPIIACEGQLINLALPPSGDRQIWGKQTVSQVFVAPRNQLNRIDLFFQTYFRTNTQDITIQLLEIPLQVDENSFPQGTTQFQTSINAAVVKNQAWHTFTFPPIKNSINKTYMITIQSPQSKPGNAITVGGIEEADTYAPGAAFLGTTLLPNTDIAFRSCYQMTTQEKFWVLSKQITRNRPGFWESPTFYWTSLGLYIILLAGLFWQLARLLN